MLVRDALRGSHRSFLIGWNHADLHGGKVAEEVWSNELFCQASECRPYSVGIELPQLCGRRRTFMFLR
jgi:hypothetical protein